jgi:hypothetical protein
MKKRTGVCRSCNTVTTATRRTVSVAWNGGQRQYFLYLCDSCWKAFNAYMTDMSLGWAEAPGGLLSPIRSEA